jgi:hypothetical protein
MATEERWRKARRSVNNANCVELNNTLDQIRDSKDTTGPTLHADVPALVHAVQAARVTR